MKNQGIKVFLFVILLFSFDQLTKYLADLYIGYGEIIFREWGFGLTYTHNQGLVFGIGDDLGFIRIIPNIVQLLFIPFSILFYRFYSINYRNSGLADWTFILFMSANLGNLTDSLLLGYVRDFIIWPGPGIPNAADVFANAGVVFFLLEVIKNPEIDTKVFLGLKSGKGKKNWKDFIEFVKEDISRFFSKKNQ